MNLEPISLAEPGRPRIDVTVRISGFFCDAFPHVVTMLDDAVRLVANLDEAAGDNYVRAHGQADLAEHGDERRSTTRIFGSKPGTYGAGLLQLIDSRNWRDDADLAQVYTRGAVSPTGATTTAFPPPTMYRQTDESVGRQEQGHPRTRHLRHDYYFQYHGGMIAAVRALSGQPRPLYRRQQPIHNARSASCPRNPPRVPRPRRQPPLDRLDPPPRLKGALEMAATVDYLFGYDATSGVVADWMYERLTESTRSTVRTASSWPSPTPGLCTVWPSGCSRRPTAACGSNPRPPRSMGCAGCCWKPRATSKVESRYFEAMAPTFAEVSEAKYLLLTTFTKDGRPKPTAVWAAPDDDRLLVITEEDVLEGQADPQHPPSHPGGVRPTRKAQG